MAEEQNSEHVVSFSAACQSPCWTVPTMKTYPPEPAHQKGQRHDQQHSNGGQHDGR
jgi:hypothetical protein